MSRFPFIKQHDSMQCGIASLAMICKYYGKEYSLEFLSHYCLPTTEGVSLLGISDAAKKLGFNVIGSCIDIESIKKAPLPCILHWNQNHFVVLYKIKHDIFYISDPSKGNIKYSVQEIQEHWISIKSERKERGVALFFEPTSAFGTIKEPEMKHSFRYLLTYIKQYQKYFAQIILGLLFSCLLQLIFKRNSREYEKIIGFFFSFLLFNFN